MLPCLLAALYSARVGWATARSPWLWQVYPPPPAAGQVSGYREAASLAADYKPLQIAYGESLVMRIQEGRDPAGDYAELAGLLERLRRLDPSEYLTWVLEAHALGSLGESSAAAEASDEAARLAPCYLSVRVLAFHMHLICVRLEPEPGAAARERHLEAALGQMRLILEAQDEAEAQLFADLGGAGVLPDEALRHWPGREPATVLARSRYLARCRAWPKLAKELSEAPLEAKAEAWYEALLGQCLVAGGDEEAGLQAWARALRKLRDKEQPAARAWLHGAIPQLAPTVLAGWVSREAADIAEDQALSLCVAQRLAEGRQWSQADRLLGLVAAKRPSREVYRAWAEAARQLGDVQEARRRARLAWDLSDKSADWGRWLDSFERAAAVEHKP
jgi:hypothetical protein